MKWKYLWLNYEATSTKQLRSKITELRLWPGLIIDFVTLEDGLLLWIFFEKTS